MRGGEGESQLEVDRRKISERITRLMADLEAVRKKRTVQRAGRKRHQWPLASIVGYTNAGKSTLLNSLTGTQVLAEDKLFATLDPTTRRLRLPTNQNVLISDTVGFIRKLPHRLVEAFKATLEEVVEADLLIHVTDLSHPQVDDQIEAVEQHSRRSTLITNPASWSSTKRIRYLQKALSNIIWKPINHRSPFPPKQKMDLIAFLPS